MTKEDVEDLMKSDYSKVSECPVLAMSEFRTKCRDCNPDIGPIEKAMLLHRYVRLNCERLAQNDSNFTTSEDRQGFLLVYKDSLAMRPKKVDKRLRSSINNTIRENEIKDHEYSLPGLGTIPTVTMGYLVNETFTGYDGIFLIDEGRKVNRWSINITSEHSMQQPEFGIPSVASDLSEPAGAEIRIKGRKKAIKKEA